MPGPGPKFNGIRADRKASVIRRDCRIDKAPSQDFRRGRVHYLEEEEELRLMVVTHARHSSVIDVRYYQDMKRWYILEDKRRILLMYNLLWGRPRNPRRPRRARVYGTGIVSSITGPNWTYQYPGIDSQSNSSCRILRAAAREKQVGFIIPSSRWRLP